MTDVLKEMEQDARMGFGALQAKRKEQLAQKFSVECGRFGGLVVMLEGRSLAGLKPTASVEGVEVRLYHGALSLRADQQVALLLVVKRLLEEKHPSLEYQG